MVYCELTPAAPVCAAADIAKITSRGDKDEMECKICLMEYEAADAVRRIPW